MRGLWLGVPCGNFTGVKRWWVSTALWPSCHAARKQTLCRVRGSTFKNLVYQSLPGARLYHFLVCTHIGRFHCSCILHYFSISARMNRLLTAALAARAISSILKRPPANIPCRHRIILGMAVPRQYWPFQQQRASLPSNWRLLLSV